MKTILQDIEVTPILQDIEVTPVLEFLYKGHVKPHMHKYVEPYDKEIKLNDLKNMDYFAIIWNEHKVDEHDIITQYKGKTYYRRACGIFYENTPVEIKCHCLINAGGQEKALNKDYEVSLGHSIAYLPVTQEEYEKLTELYNTYCK